MAPKTIESNFTPTEGVGTNSSPATACVFLDRLPLEIRLMIYRKLLVQEINAKSEEYNDRREAILAGPDHSYDFCPSMLGTSRQIREEIMGLIQREYILVSMTYDTEGYGWNTELRDCGVAIVSQKAQARANPIVGLTIEVSASGQGTDDATDPHEQHQTSLFMLEDLPAACIFLQGKIGRYNRRSQDSNIRVIVSSPVGAISYGSQDGGLLRKSQVRRYLGPLWRLHGATRAAVYGGVDPTYKAAIIASMCGRRLKAKEYMRLVGVQFDEGDKALHEDRLWAAIAAYKAALLTIRGTSCDADEIDETLIGGRFHGHLAARARDISEVRLHTLIAESYLRCGKYRMARIYVERIYGPLYSMDDRANHRKLPLDIPRDNQVASGTYAELLHVAARISLVHGQEGEAIAELSEACELDPWDRDIKELLEQVRARRDARIQRRYLQEEHQRKCAEEKHAAAVLVASNRKIKGDQASDNQDLMRAQRYYEAAYDKVWEIESISRRRALTVLMSEICFKLIKVFLGLKQYDEFVAVQ